MKRHTESFISGESVWFDSYWTTLLISGCFCVCMWWIWKIHQKTKNIIMTKKIKSPLFIWCFTIQ